jgi:hypothetical protein
MIELPPPTLRDALLPKLISGDVRLKHVERFTLKAVP